MIAITEDTTTLGGNPPRPCEIPLTCPCELYFRRGNLMLPLASLRESLAIRGNL
ncbi:hypothetical protein [Helicobacter sp.]|uniref:hypothetical protein n=1 Tax=Helicobacter sp. TaxID=218 RepID=UPI0019C3EC4B|nr:hypothetical protein [Helicobacter sp.]MBD5164872.1 hypothetical protein [Helicobacter sp.]